RKKKNRFTFEHYDHFGLYGHNTIAFFSCIAFLEGNLEHIRGRRTNFRFFMVKYTGLSNCLFFIK
ncbi:MAG: hypothetical protein L0L35_07880, partial [Enterococcus sp.]|nr:hypothetical protein [Enterococcus sp.]